MTEKELKARLRAFAISVARVCNKLPYSVVNKTYCNQLIRSSSSSASNYRAACRAKSSKDFSYKLEVVVEELDESEFFLDMLLEFNFEFSSELAPLINESDQLTAIMVASVKTVHNNIKHKKLNNHS